MPCAPFEGVAALHPLGAPNYFTDKEKKDEKKTPRRPSCASVDVIPP